MASDERGDPKADASQRIATVEDTLRRWDPIGIQPGKSGPNDEYDSYAPHVVSLVASGCSTEQLSQHLGSIRTGSMGIGANAERDREIADEILTALRMMGA